MDKIDANKICKGLGENSRNHREKAHLTQAEVAEQAGIDVNYYARIERGLGNPSYIKLHSIMTALKMDSLRIK
jgi:transcriptional regulator with XRE-family HTH domain